LNSLISFKNLRVPEKPNSSDNNDDDYNINNNNNL
jgi:hypothetical protein